MVPPVTGAAVSSCRPVAGRVPVALHEERRGLYASSGACSAGALGVTGRGASPLARPSSPGANQSRFRSRSGRCGWEPPPPWITLARLPSRPSRPSGGGL